MNKHIISLPHHPKRVIAISLIIALIIGFLGYKKINQKPDDLYVMSQASTPIDSNTNITLGFLSGGRIKSVLVKAGDIVKKGDILATLDAENVLGSLTQAKASYSTAQANYQKVINGATGTAIDVAKATVNTAKVNLDGVTKQQSLLVSNSYQSLLNSTIQAISTSTSNTSSAPTITGTYTGNKEGNIKLSVYQGGNGGYFSTTGLVSSSGIVSTTNAQLIGDSGLYIQFPSNYVYQNDWNITLPNTQANNYLTNYNNYQNALQNKNQAIANAQAILDQANASLLNLVTSARPEDIATAQAQVNSAEGAVQVAQGAYNNTIITAPSDGRIVSVSITPGQIAIPNASAIEFISSSKN